MKNPRFTRGIILFFFLIIFITAFPVLLWTIYPLLGMDRLKAFSNSRLTMALVVVVLTGISIFIRFKLRPAEAVIAARVAGKELSDTEKQVILHSEAFIRLFFTIAMIVGFLLVGAASVAANALRDHIIRWSTIRFLVVTVSAGPALSVLINLYISYSMQRVKQICDIYEFSQKASAVSYRVKTIAALLSFSLFVVILLGAYGMAKEEAAAGLSRTAVTFRAASFEKPSGLFSSLMEKALASDDPSIRGEALAIETAWRQRSAGSLIETAAVGLIALLLFGVVSFIFISDLSGHLQGIVAKLRSIVALDGDMTHFLVKTAGDEMGEIQVLFNQLILNLNRSFQRIFDSASAVIRLTQSEKANINNLLEANRILQASSTAVGEGIRSQSEVITKTAGLVKEAVELINRNILRLQEQSDMVEKSGSASALMNESIAAVSKATQKADSLGSELLASSRDGLESSSKMSERISEISRSGSGITSVIDTIVSITGQTDILAMNAAIEAAHAGEYGKGFAVVAAEIRSHAESTDRSTKEIESILREMAKNISASSQSSQGLSTSMQKIGENVEDTIKLIREINAAAQEQYRHSGETLRVISELVRMNQTIMEDLKRQKGTNQELLDRIARMEEAAGLMKETGRMQEESSQGLNSRFNGFLEYFQKVESDFSILEKMLSSVKLLDRNFQA